LWQGELKKTNLGFSEAAAADGGGLLDGGFFPAAPKIDAGPVSASRWSRFRFRPALPAGNALSRPVSLLLGLLG